MSARRGHAPRRSAKPPAADPAVAPLSAAHAQAIIASSPDAIISLDLQLRIQTWNESAARLFGWRPEEVLGRALDTILIEADEHQAATLISPLGGGKSITRWEAVYYTQNGGEIEVEVAMSDLWGEEGYVAVLTDIGAERRAQREKALLEQQLTRVKRLEAIGRLAGGVAHDFNNLLGVIADQTRHLAEGLRPPDPRAEAVHGILRAIQQATDLTQQLLAVGRAQPLRYEQLDVNQLLLAAEPLLRDTLGTRSALVLELSEALPSIKADRTQLERILLNLVRNARDAIPERGTVAVSTAPAAGTGPTAGQPGILLTVSDDGTGMDKETRAHLFEPFFTTKGAGQGTGLGLATVYGAVEQHGGTIAIDSAPGRGTRVAIWLPVQGALGAPPPPTAPPLPATSLPPLVLVVEDQDMLRVTLYRVLTRAGYEVLMTGDGRQALALADNAPRPLRLLVSDMRLPGLSGPALAAKLRERDPALRVLLLSGQAPREWQQAQAIDAFLLKPFNGDTLLETVQALIGKAEPAPILAAPPVTSER